MPVSPCPFLLEYKKSTINSCESLYLEEESCVPNIVRKETHFGNQKQKLNGRSHRQKYVQSLC